jgi:hypothetical protein
MQALGIFKLDAPAAPQSRDDRADRYVGRLR